MKTTRVRTASLTLADQVWVVVALLHREHPDRADFAIPEILDRARREPIALPLRPGFHVHVIQHCVANRPPNPGRSRVLVETGRGRRRLFRPGDPYDPAREGARVVPAAEALPEPYRPLLAWYREVYVGRAPASSGPADLLLALRGSGRRLWADEAPDAYVQRLREDWR
jgi:hypothetical protein